VTTTAHGSVRSTKSIQADWFEQALALLAVLLLMMVLAALARGYADWGKIPATVWLHLATIIPTVALTPVMLLRRRGDRLHRALGTIWVAAMLATALGSFSIRNANDGGFSFIHILSVWTCIQVPVIWWSARTHQINRHRQSVRGMVTGALLIAGFFTFPFNRMLGQFLFG